MQNKYQENEILFFEENCKVLFGPVVNVRELTEGFFPGFEYDIGVYPLDEEDSFQLHSVPERKLFEDVESLYEEKVQKLVKKFILAGRLYPNVFSGKGGVK